MKNSSNTKDKVSYYQYFKSAINVIKMHGTILIITNNRLTGKKIVSSSKYSVYYK